MNITQKIEKSKDTTCFTMYREGLFYKFYNEDAMVFAQSVKAYKVSSKFVKSVGAEVLSLGFPVSEVQKRNISFEAILQAVKAASYKENSNGVVFLLKEDIKQYYDEYKETIIKANDIEVEKDTSNNDDVNSQKLIKLIREFDLANCTPMQGLVFIQELKNYIKTQV